MRDSFGLHGLGSLFLLMLLYLLPALVAQIRLHRNATAIAALTLLLGWTGLGWIAALVWALTNDPSIVKRET